MILTLDCEQSAQLTSQSFDRPLSWAEKIAGKLHRIICSKSRRLDIQLILLNQALESKLSDESMSIAASLSDAAKERIRERLCQEPR